MTLGFLFRTAPHGTTSGREGLDAVLACSAYCETISIFFSGDGVFQLLSGQLTDGILSRNYALTFKAFELYDIESVFVCADSLRQRGLTAEQLMMPVRVLEQNAWNVEWQACQKILTF